MIPTSTKVHVFIVNKVPENTFLFLCQTTTSDVCGLSRNLVKWGVGKPPVYCGLRWQRVNYYDRVDEGRKKCTTALPHKIKQVVGDMTTLA